jgi:outer membrane protein
MKSYLNSDIVKLKTQSMTIKNKLSTFFAILAISFSGAIQAQKFGHVNLQEFVASMPEYKTAEENMEKFQESLRAELMEMQQEIMDKEKRLARDAADLTELVRQKKAREIEEMREKFQEFIQEAQQLVQNEEMKELSPIYDLIEKAVAEVAKEHSYTYIFDSSKGKSVLHTTGEDVSPLLKKQLEKLRASK